MIEDCHELEADALIEKALQEARGGADRTTLVRIIAAALRARDAQIAGARAEGAADAEQIRVLRAFLQDKETCTALGLAPK